MKQCILSLAVLLIPMSAAAALSSSCNDGVEVLAPDSRYVVQNSDTEVLDKTTGLVWQRCPLGFSGADCSTAAVTTTFTWKDALEAASADWRLPNVKELASLVEPRCHAPAVNKTLFPNTGNVYYWSASPLFESGNANAIQAWTVSFISGQVVTQPKNASHRVRLIKK